MLYTYDNVGQLVRENNAELNKTFVYVYDKGGNIARKVEYAYTTGDLGEVVSTINYTYDSVWKDKLTAYGEEQIQTDSMGNPLNYINKNLLGETSDGTLEWNGRQLAAAEVNGSRFEYSYNSDGLRTSVRKYNLSGQLEQVFYYFWQGGKLSGYIVEDESGNVDYIIKMLYNNSRESFGYVLEDIGNAQTSTLLFEKNLQGDITGVYDSGYGLVVEYKYDAWGNVTVEYFDNLIGQALKSLEVLLYTPITYRGYMYDPYTGLYYLQSRYYNPTYGRFLNPDSIMKTGEPLGANIFAYCGNNPVNYVDYDGRELISLTALLTIITVIAVIILLIVIIHNLNKKSGNNNDKIENAYKLVEKFKEFHDLSEDYWLAFYYHSKNVVEYGTGVNKNPTFPYYDKFNFTHSYEFLCGEAYFYLRSFLLGPNERWADMSPERRLKVMDSMAWYDLAMYNNIVNYFAGSFYKWGTETYEVFWGIVKDMATL